jgi:hypothetical protein
MSSRGRDAIEELIDLRPPGDVLAIPSSFIGYLCSIGSVGLPFARIAAN